MGLAVRFFATLISGVLKGKGAVIPVFQRVWEDFRSEKPFCEAQTSYARRALPQ
jgi:hypothetical protein